MKKNSLKLSQLSIQSFVTTIDHVEKLKGGTICEDISLAGPTLCITGEECETLVEETCHSTGNQGDPTGFMTRNPSVCINSN